MFNKLRMLLKAKKPEILLVGGLIALGGGIIGACNASREVDDILDETADEIEEIRGTEDGVKAEKEIRKQRGLCAWRLFKLYVLPVILICIGIAGIISSHSAMAARVEGVSLKLAETAGGFAAYRSVVRRDLGEDADRHFMYDTGVCETTKDAYVDEDGVSHPSETRVWSETIDSETVKNNYIFFDEGSCYFDRENPQNNITFLHLACEDLERELKNQRFLFSYRIKERLGYSHKSFTPDDMVTGVIYDGKSPMIDPDTGEKLFSLGLYNAFDRRKRMNGELGRTFILNPTSYGVGMTYILDKFSSV